MITYLTQNQIVIVKAVQIYWWNNLIEKSNFHRIDLWQVFQFSLCYNITNLFSSDNPVPAESTHGAGYAYSPSTHILSLHCSPHETLQVLDFNNTAERSNDCSITVVSLRQSQSKDSWCHVKLEAKLDLLLTLIVSEKLLSSHIYEVIKLRHKKRFIAKNLCSLHWRTYICWVLEGREGSQPIFNCSPYTVWAFRFKLRVQWLQCFVVWHRTTPLISDLTEGPSPQRKCTKVLGLNEIRGYEFDNEICFTNRFWLPTFPYFSWLIIATTS